jgi:hypothetical protein
LPPAPRGGKKDAYKFKDLWDEDGSAAAAGSLDGMSSPKKSLHPPIMVWSLATTAEAIHDCESLGYFCSRDGPEMVRAPGTEERRVMIRPTRFHFIFGNGMALDLYLDCSDLKYCCGWTQTTSKTMSSTVALKDFYNTWFNSIESKAEIEASLRDLADSACPLMHEAKRLCRNCCSSFLPCGATLLSAQVFACVGPAFYSKTLW